LKSCANFFSAGEVRRRRGVEELQRHRCPLSTLCNANSAFPWGPNESYYFSRVPPGPDSSTGAGRVEFNERVAIYVHADELDAARALVVKRATEEQKLALQGLPLRHQCASRR
jgi:hypothetical protein